MSGQFVENAHPLTRMAGCDIMTQTNLKSRTAMTAIAAVIALSSTPLLAQDASVPDPVADTATETPVTATPDPLAPNPGSTTAASPETTEAAPARKASTARATPASRRSASATRSSSNRAASSARAAPVAPAAPAAEGPAEMPLPIAAEAPPIAEPIAPPPAEAEPVGQNDAIEDALPIAGAAGLGLLALAGFGLAARRRRRRREDEEYEANQWALAHAEAEPEPQPAAVVPEPVFARPTAPAQNPAPNAGPATALPAGFDISKFGRHVQAAYRGPTPDNPSLSLKNRLRRASFFDQQERRAEEAATVTAEPAAKPAWAARKPNEAEFMFRPAAKKQAYKPTFQ